MLAGEPATPAASVYAFGVVLWELRESALFQS